MHKKLYLWFFLCSFLFCLHTSLAQQPAAENSLNPLSEKINTLLKKYRFNGSIIVAQDDSIIYEKYQGWSNRKAKIRVTKNTPFHIASVSKTFTAMAILKLYQDKKIDVYDKVSKYIKGFPYQHITLVHLLCHQSGIPYYAYFMPRTRRKNYKNIDVVKQLITYKPRLRFRAGSRFKYCNTNYVLLAYIISQVTKVSYETYLRETFWKPYGFQNTFVFNSLKEIPKATPSYTYRYYRYHVTSLDFICGDKGVYASAQDLVKWNKLLCDTTLFDSVTLNLAYTAFSKIPSSDKTKIKSYGLGWRIFYTDDYYKVVYHNGWWHGNKTVFIRIPDLKYTIIAMENTSSSAVYKLSSYIPLLIPPSPTQPMNAILTRRQFLDYLVLF